MADAVDPPQAKPARRPRKALFLAAAAAVVPAGVGFWLSYSGLVLNPSTDEAKAEHSDATAEIAFVAIEPLIVSLGAAGTSQHLRFAAQLEVPAAFAEEVAHLQPRILDVLNGYLRAVDVAQLEDPSALVLLRAQMLRRIQIVTGEGRVSDLLITEFVLN